MSAHPAAERVGAAVGAMILPLLAVIAAAWFALEAWPAIVAAAIALGFARRRWPGVAVKAYFKTLKVTLPILSAFAGEAAVLAFLLRATPLLAMAGGVVAAACLSTVVLIFEGRIMNAIFDLVPIDQQDALAAQLDDLDASTKGAEGQAADLSGLDPDAVTRAIKQRVIGQDAIVEAVVQTTFRRARLARPNKPIGVDLFVGATGAGKTELAKAVAAEFFANRLIRIDCNELSESHNVQRLIGPPPGYQGADQGGQLCRDLARVGTGVLLLDEIEKAHPAALKVLMNLLDEARLTEQSTGRTYSARGFLIVLTSNAAADAIVKVAAVESDPVLRVTKVKDVLRDAGFLPEILARIDAIFPFTSLSGRDVARVIERFLLKFAGDVGVTLESCDAALLLDLVTRSKKTAAYGIREVVRSVENAVVDGLIDVKDHGYTRAVIRVIDGAVSVQPVAAEAPAVIEEGAQS